METDNFKTMDAVPDSVSGAMESDWEICRLLFTFRSFCCLLVSSHRIDDAVTMEGRQSHSKSI